METHTELRASAAASGDERPGRREMRGQLVLPVLSGAVDVGLPSVEVLVAPTVVELGEGLADIFNELTTRTLWIVAQLPATMQNRGLRTLH